MIVEMEAYYCQCSEKKISDKGTRALKKCALRATTDALVRSRARVILLTAFDRKDGRLE